MAPRDAVYRRRQKRIAELVKGDLDVRVRTGLRHLWESGRQPSTIRLRPVFSRSADSPPGVPRNPPPASRLLQSRGIAMRFYLLALFVSQCSKGTGSRAVSSLRLSHGDGEVTWVDLVAVDAAGERRTKEPRTRLDNTVRQIKGALHTLQDEGLAEIRTIDGARRYADFVIMHERGRGELATPRTYTVPRASEGTIDLPVEFFLNGWIQVLQPSELATWLMFRDLARRFPREHSADGVYVYGDTRQDEYHLRRDAYEGHDMLRGLGLLQYAPSARPNPDGTVTIRFAAQYEPHHFQLTDQGLAELAVPTMLGLLQKRLGEP